MASLNHTFCLCVFSISCPMFVLDSELFKVNGRFQKADPIPFSKRFLLSVLLLQVGICTIGYQWDLSKQMSLLICCYHRDSEPSRKVFIRSNSIQLANWFHGGSCPPSFIEHLGACLDSST